MTNLVVYLSWWVRKTLVIPSKWDEAPSRQVVEDRKPSFQWTMSHDLLCFFCRVELTCPDPEMTTPKLANVCKGNLIVRHIIKWGFIHMIHMMHLWKMLGYPLFCTNPNNKFDHGWKMFSGYLNSWQPQPSGILRSSDMIIPGHQGEIIDWNVWLPQGIKSHVITIAVSIPYKPILITIWYPSTWKFIKPSFRNIQNGTTLVNVLLIVVNVLDGWRDWLMFRSISSGSF